MTDHHRSLDPEHVANGREVGAVFIDRAALPCIGSFAQTAAKQIKRREPIAGLVQSLYQRTPRRVVVLKAVYEHQVAVTASRLPDGQAAAPNLVPSHCLHPIHRWAPVWAGRSTGLVMRPMKALRRTSLRSVRLSDGRDGDELAEVVEVDHVAGVEVCAVGMCGGGDE